MKIVRFLAFRDLAGFDVSQSVAEEWLVRQLHCCDYLNTCATSCWSTNRVLQDARSLGVHVQALTGAALVFLHD